MIESITLDQMRTLVAAVDEGSFSAAGRKIGRAQSVVSQTISGLETQLKVVLFERIGRYPTPTEAGAALANEARAVLRQAGQFRARARDLASGIEPEVSIVIDAMFPIEILTSTVTDFEASFPDTQLRVHVESLGAVIQPVLDKRCSFAVSGVVPLFPPEVELEHLFAFRLILVAAPGHPLAQPPGPLSSKQLAEYVQLVLTDRSSFSDGQQFGVIAQKTWRLADLGAKHAFLKGGLGWGSMPMWMIQGDLSAGRLVELNVQSSVWPEGNQMTMYALHRHDTPPGPAGRWLIKRLRDNVLQCTTFDEAHAVPSA
ncbi:DNA-binding transcriptional LysR family regulator [Mesorhizobium soli]|jgi:DNA-binding transcriptional LysR family regulator|uniref:LysR family transcriptional regulator n=1 Tax=Pseudaminobacter soli (ex Li et al. 2025) TaxID=1295366 RepID=UPI0024769427|nr:LysR family transcriptional regulator [Mesorhizobium soli]MDH6234765.1 DNA-binding transcriptional LysR family regulator [Mesorhizobium soli]